MKRGHEEISKSDFPGFGIVDEEHQGEEATIEDLETAIEYAVTAPKIGGIRLFKLKDILKLIETLGNLQEIPTAKSASIRKSWIQVR